MLDIKDFRCPSCDGPLVAFNGVVGHRFGVYLTCKDTIDGPESCPDATGICSDLQEALGYLVPDPVEPTRIVPESDIEDFRAKIKVLRKALHLTVSDLELANEWSSQDNFRTAINEGLAALEATKEGA